MIKIDFHTHTYHSYDSFMKPRGILKRASERGLTHIVINDHDTIRGGIECKSIEKQFGVSVIVGSEIKTDIGDVTGIFLKEEIERGPYLEVIGKIKKQNGLAILNHPFVGHKLSDLKFEAFDLIEGYNGRCNAEQNKQAVELARLHHKPFIAGSDAHLYNEIANCYSTFHDLDSLLHPIESVYSGSHKANYIFSQLIKAYKKKDLVLMAKVMASAPKKILLNK